MASHSTDYTQKLQRQSEHEPSDVGQSHPNVGSRQARRIMERDAHNDDQDRSMYSQREDGSLKMLGSGLDHPVRSQVEGHHDVQKLYHRQSYPEQPGSTTAWRYG